MLHDMRILSRIVGVQRMKQSAGIIVIQAWKIYDDIKNVPGIYFPGTFLGKRDFKKRKLSNHIIRTCHMEECHRFLTLGL